ncbi:MAG: peptide deformylase [Eubacteriaceae bacterium]|jgi:peptide deformylase|nr:peptide deformylase [Eubacteriaceae bacterium]
MAIRYLRVNDDPILRKNSREITEVDERLKILEQDMLDTMYEHEGVGLAAPQVGVLKRIVVIDVGEGPMTLLNPEITASEGEVCEVEGCLSFPERAEMVPRPEKVTVQYQNMDLENEELECEGLLARAVCHEVDHVNGIVFLDKAVEGQNEEKS